MRAWAVALCSVIGACGFSIPSGVGPGEAGVIDTPPSDTTVVADAPRIIDSPPDANLVTTGLIAWYRMDTLTTIEDSTGHGHTGACSNCPTLVTGKIGSGFNFDGSNDRITVASSTELNTTAGFTVAFWVQFDTLPGSGYSCPVNKYFGSTNSNSWQLCYDGAMAQWFYGTAVGGNGFSILRRAPGPTADTWIHAAITWDGATKRIWINGLAVTDAPATGITFDMMPITIGADLENSAQNGSFDGILDDVRIYNRVLTSPEVALLASM